MSQVAITNRCLDTLELMAGEPAGLPLTSIAQRLGLGKSATHRLLSALQAEGCVTQDARSQFYRMTSRIPIMGLRHLSGTGIVNACQPHLDRLAARTGELVRLTVADDGHLIWIAKAQGAKSELRFDAETGHEVRLHTTASGKAWLAALPADVALRVLRAQGLRKWGKRASTPVSLERILKDVQETKRCGYGIAVDEDEIGMSAVAAAICVRDGTAHVFGTVSVAGPSVRLSRTQMEAVAKDVISTAHTLAKVWPQVSEAQTADKTLPAHAPTRKVALCARQRTLRRTDQPSCSAVISRNEP